MKFNLHNKYEIIVGDKTYVAYNTLTHNVFDALENFKQYFTYIALGRGTSLSVNYDSDYLENFCACFPAVLEDIQCDPSKGTMFVKKYVELPAGEYDTLSFSEIAATNQIGVSNPLIYSHVYVKDENGEVLTIVKEEHQSVYIRITIYIEMDDASRGYLTAGENQLIKALLGEVTSVPTITFARGYNLSSNQQPIYRQSPRDAKKIKSTFTRVKSENGKEQFVYEFDAKSGATAELIMLFDDSPVARLSTFGMSEELIQIETTTVSQQNNTMDIGEYIVDVLSVTDANGNAVSGYVEKRYAKEFSDFIANPFEANFNSQCARWVSKDGDKIAFIADNTLYIYKNQNYNLIKINNSIKTENLSKVIMFKDCIFAIYSTSPYFLVYKIKDDSVYNISTNFSAYETFDSTYDWQRVEIIDDSNGNFLIGVIFGSIARNPLLIYASIQANIFKVTKVEYGVTDYIVDMFSLYKNSFCDSRLCFITNNYNGEAESYRIEYRYIDGTYQITDEMVAYYLSNNTVSLEGKSRAAVAKKSVAPYIWLYYYPQVYRYSITLTQGIQNWISTNLMYLIQKYDNTETPYKIYSLTDYNNPQEFTSGLPAQIDQTSITDFEFVGDTLLIFTSSTTYALNLKETYSMLENLPEANATYTISAKQEPLFASKDTEGLLGNFTIEFDV